MVDVVAYGLYHKVLKMSRSKFGAEVEQAQVLVVANGHKMVLELVVMLLDLWQDQAVQVKLD
jgi:hypothetical protein